MASSTSILRNVLSPMLPINMLLRIYSFLILILDVAWVYINAVFAVFEAVFQIIKPPPLKSVEDETVMVIGSGRGVGREIAIQMAFLGAKVICVDQDEANNSKTVSYINRKGGKAVSYTRDISKKENVDHLAGEIKREVGFISMMFYCCGIPSPRALMTQPPQDIHDTLDLTLSSYFWLIENFLPEMKVKKKGHIIALTSVAGLSHMRNQMPLSVAQFAVQGLAESLMEDLRINKIDGVHISLIHVYPFIVDDTSDFRLKIPSYFGTMTPHKAAISIIESVLRNYPEASVPKHLNYMGNILRILPRKATVLIRDLLDTGVDFA